MSDLDSARRRELRALAHHLHPVVSIGQGGLTPAVLHEIDVNLLAHELIKVRASSDDRDEREAMLRSICEAVGALPVQHIGKLLIVYRPAPEEPAPEPQPRRRAAGVRTSDRRPPTPSAMPRSPARSPVKPATDRRRPRP